MERNNNSNHEKNQRLLNRSTLLLLFGCIIILLIFSYIKFALYDVPISSLIDDIISGIPGTLLSIIIFNVAYEYLTKDETSEEISEKVASVLVGNPEIMGSFDKNARIEFIKSTMTSLIGEKKAGIVYDMLDPYITNETLCYKRNFHYQIDIEEYPMEKYFSTSDYLQISEDFSYERCCENAFDTDEVCVGFFVDDRGLMDGFQNKSYVFRENLDVNRADMDALKDLSEEEKVDLIEKYFDLTLFMDNQRLERKAINIVTHGNSVTGIVVTYKFENINLSNPYSVRVAFKMPQLRKSYLLVVISEMTYSPQIWLHYDPHKIAVSAYEFLDQSPQIIDDADAIDGRIRVCPPGWVYPVRGIVFTIGDVDKGGSR